MQVSIKYYTKYEHFSFPAESLFSSKTLGEEARLLQRLRGSIKRGENSKYV